MTVSSLVDRKLTLNESWDCGGRILLAVLERLLQVGGGLQALFDGFYTRWELVL